MKELRECHTFKHRRLSRFAYPVDKGDNMVSYDVYTEYRGEYEKMTKKEKKDVILNVDEDILIALGFQAVQIKDGNEKYVCRICPPGKFIRSNHIEE